MKYIVKVSNKKYDKTFKRGDYRERTVKNATD